VLDAGGVDPALTPSTVTAHAVGRRVLWGGGVISSMNRERSTELEVLAYPLRENQRPDDRAAPLGRFLVLHPGYLETLDYGQGRRVTVRGRVAEVRQAEVGRSPRALPVVESEAIHLWPVGQDYAWRPWPVQLGFGIWVSN
jgi:outer membrane lipoprotein